MLHVLSANMYPLSISPPLALAHFSFPHPCYSLPAPCLLFSATLSHSGQAVKLAGPNSLSLKSMHITSFSSPSVTYKGLPHLCVAKILISVSKFNCHRVTCSEYQQPTWVENLQIKWNHWTDGTDLNSYLILCVLVIHESTHTHLHAHTQTHTHVIILHWITVIPYAHILRKYYEG